jgi:glycosyltransferase involved in cell wall biosynthesis
MSRPLVSICLPNLNTLPYLRERVETIAGQTYTNWELIVSDNCSDDGAWAFFEELARTDPRVSIAQAPREGMYANWNRCVERARGELVYIATSDDTMAADCLEKLVAALEANPECDIAHCRLRPIDEHGADRAETYRWWTESSAFADSSGPLLHEVHVRKAPFDGLLHLLGGSVYVSITQLLVRRRLFDRIGGFESRWGSVGDFNWSMRAGFVANTVHVPGTWGGWRVHRTQATARVKFTSVEHAERIDEMIEHALAACRHVLAPALRQRLDRWTREAKERRDFAREVATREDSALRRRGFILRCAGAGSAPAREYLASYFLGRPASSWVQRCLDETGHGPSLGPANLAWSSVPSFT